MEAADYGILAGYLAAVLGIGVYARRAGADSADFFLAGRSMGWFPIGLSVMVTVFSAINYVALPSEVFAYGLSVIVALPVFFVAVWPINRFWMPFFFDMQLVSAYEYLERRFDSRVRSLASGLFVLWRIFWMATSLYASGSILGVLSGHSGAAVILTCGIAATLYTVVGGMRAVMWTDVAQFCVLFGGIVTGLVLVSGENSFRGLFVLAHEGGRLQPFVPFDPSFLSLNPFLRMSLWSVFLGTLVAFLTRYGADQVVLQRYFTARNLQAARRGLWFSALASVLSLTLLVLFGLAVYVHAVQSGALGGIAWDQLPTAQKNGLAMAQLGAVIRSFPAGITGLVCAGLLAATMSSIDSGINACSAAYMSDFHPHLRRVVVSPIRMDRLLTLTLGTLATGMALALIPLVGQTNGLFMIVNRIINGLGSPLLALVLMGMFSASANGPGMLIGGLFGITASLVISLSVDELALHYYAIANLLATLVPCYLFSHLACCLGHEPPGTARYWTWRAWRGRG